MNLHCLSEYHNEPRGLHFAPGVIDVDEAIAEFLLRDAPENFKRGAEGRGAGEGGAGSEGKALDGPPRDKAVKKVARK